MCLKYFFNFWVSILQVFEERTREMTPWFGILVSFPENVGSIPSIHMISVIICNSSPEELNAFYHPWTPGMHISYKYICRKKQPCTYNTLIKFLSMEKIYWYIQPMESIKVFIIFMLVFIYSLMLSYMHNII